MPPSTLDLARQYTARGWSVIPIAHKEKGPTTPGWQNLRLTDASLPKYFGGALMNIGVLVGVPSGHLVDVDLDCMEAVRLAPDLLPQTQTFGRKSKRRSHWLYTTPGVETEKFVDPRPTPVLDDRGLPLLERDGRPKSKKQMLVEVRSSGAQTVFPGSTHPSGEPVEFDPGDDSPTALPAVELRALAAKLAVAALFARYAPTALDTFMRTGSCAALPDDLRATAGQWLGFAPVAAPAPAAAPAPRPSSSNRPGAYDRARAYAASVPGAIEGGGGDEHTFKLACALVRGFALSDEDALAVLRDWNATCTPPWNDAGLVTKVRSARKNGEEAFGARLEQDSGTFSSPPLRPEPPHPADCVNDAPAREPGCDDDAPAPAPTPALYLGSKRVSVTSEWPTLEPLDGALLKVDKFHDEYLLPESIRPWLLDIGNRLQVPIEYLATSAIVSIGAVIGRRCGIRPKRKDSWVVVPNFWGAIVGPPGVMKTPAVTEAMRPLKRLAHEANVAYDQEAEKYAAADEVAKTRRDALKAQLKKAIQRDEDTTWLRAELEKPDEQIPPRPRYLVNDATTERLAEMLNENPRGLLLFRDELLGWLKGLERQGKETDRPFYLETWNGTSSYSQDRIARGYVRVDHACLSVFGTAQPGALQKYLAEAAEFGAGADGLMQRFQLLVYPDISKDWTNVDEYPDKRSRDDAYRIFKALDTCAPADWGAETDDHDDDEIPYLRFDDAGQELFDSWRAQLEHRIRACDDSQVLVEHLSKYRKLFPALALTFHLADRVAGTSMGRRVSEHAAEMALGWCNVLESHARRVYNAGARRVSEQLARALAVKLGELPNPFSVREVVKKHWAGLDRSGAERAANDLVESGWLKQVQISTGGRSKVAFAINPAALKVAA